MQETKKPSHGSDNEQLDLPEAVAAYVEMSKSDVYLYNGPISDENADRFIGILIGRKQKKKIGTLILTTYGGDPDAGFRIARALQRHHDRLRLFVVGPCKSAGTLIAVGADELVFGPYGELGPLDIQLARPDEMILQSSGLDHLTALGLVQSHAFSAFEDIMLQLVRKSQGAISTKTASEIAVQLVSGLFEPIAAQIDPHRVSEVQRMMDIAKHYGLRLKHPNLKEGTLDSLIERYPSHSHVIDFEDCCSLFVHVTELSDKEADLIKAFGKAVTKPSSEAIIMDLTSLAERATEQKDGQTTTNDQNSRAHSPGKPRADRENEVVSDSIPSTRKRVKTDSQFAAGNGLPG